MGVTFFYEILENKSIMIQNECFFKLKMVIDRDQIMKYEVKSASGTLCRTITFYLPWY
jgi:hypothetical protein